MIKHEGFVKPGICPVPLYSKTIVKLFISHDDDKNNKTRADPEAETKDIDNSQKFVSANIAKREY